MNLDSLGILFADGYVEIIRHIPDEDLPDFETLLKDSWLAGYETLKPHFRREKLNAETLLDFISQRGLAGELDEYLNEQKIDGYKDLINRIGGLQ